MNLKSNDPFHLTGRISWPADADSVTSYNRDNLSPFPMFRPRITEVYPVQHESVLQPQDHAR